MSVATRPMDCIPVADPAPVRNLAGIGFAMLGLFLFAANNVAMKALVGRYPPGEMVMIRSVVSLAYLLPLMRVRDIVAIWRTSRPALHVLRVAISAVEVTCYFTALTVLPLADITVFYLATPIYVTALSTVLLGERVGWRRWAAVIVGFGGVLIALNPSADALSRPALIGFAGGVLFALVVVTTRGLRGTPNRMLVTLQLGAILIASLAMADGRWRLPEWRDLLLLMGVGTISVLGYISFNHSLRIAPASVVSPFQYTSILWAGLFGYAVFGDLPKPSVVLGAAVIVAAGLFILLRERARAAASPRHT